MLKSGKIIMKAGMAVALVVSALAMAAPPVTTQAAVTIVVDDDTTAGDCGRYDDGSPEADPVTAIFNAPSGSTVVICPGTYTLTSRIDIVNKKLTIKRALTDPGQTPVLVADPSLFEMIHIFSTSTVTIDGLIIDGRPSTQPSYSGIFSAQSALTLKNSTILGPDQSGSRGVFLDNAGLEKYLSSSVTNCVINGYTASGIYAGGPVKLTVKSSHLDATDGGRLTGPVGTGVYFAGPGPDPSPTGTVTRSRLMHNGWGVTIDESSKVSVTNNMLIDNTTGVYIGVDGSSHNADSNKVTGNTIVGVPESGFGVSAYNGNPAVFTMKGLTISKNVIFAGKYTPDGIWPLGVFVSASAPAATMVTGTISGNTFWGFPLTPSPLHIVNENGYAGVTVGKNTVTP